jgi:protein ImuB
MISRQGSRRVVASLDAAARRQGLMPGMPVSKAKALCAGLVTHDLEVAQDAAALERLALWALRHYAPVVAVDPPDGLMIDISGAAHLYGGEAGLMRDLIHRLGATGIAARMAIADTYGAAHALSRFVADTMLALDEAAARPLLRSLAVEALRLDTAITEGLHRLGFESIGDLYETPRAPLTQRFGPMVCRRLDQMFSDAREPFELVSAPQQLRIVRGFVEPIAAPETIARYIGLLAGQLCERLEAKALGVRKVDLLFFRVDSDVQAVRIGTAKPLRDALRLTRLLCDRIETVSPGFGIEQMILCASATEPLAYKPYSSLIEAPAADVSGLIDTLANRVGGHRIYRLTPVESELPERSVRRIPALSAPSKASWGSAWPRPPRLLDPPERIETLALLPDHPPAAFTWRGIRRRIARADGPERLFGEWWKRANEQTMVRDYFQVEDEAGERFWLFRAGDGEDPQTGSQSWFIHGLFG